MDLMTLIFIVAFALGTSVAILQIFQGAVQIELGDTPVGVLYFGLSLSVIVSLVLFFWNPYLIAVSLAQSGIITLLSRRGSTSE